MSAPTAPTSAESGFVLKGRHVLAMVVSFFAVVIGVDGAFTWLALKTHPGQVSVTPYEDGLLYNRHIAQLDAQARLGWTAAVEASAGKVTLVYSDRDGRAVRGLSVSGRLERPATEAGRQFLTFRETAPGRYEARSPVSGAWDLTADAHDRHGARFTAERRLTWP